MLASRVPGLFFSSILFAASRGLLLYCHASAFEWGFDGQLPGTRQLGAYSLVKSRNLFSIPAYCEPLPAGLAPKGPKDPILRYFGLGKELCRFLFVGRVYDN